MRSAPTDTIVTGNEAIRYHGLRLKIPSKGSMHTCDVVVKLFQAVKVAKST